MYTVQYYRDKNGKSSVEDYLTELAGKKDKDSRVNFKKITDYIDALRLHGKAVGEPYIKHIESDIWELRPLKNRILFFGYDGERFVLLSHFIKKTRKTPKSEIEKAIRLMNDYKERSGNNG